MRRLVAVLAASVVLAGGLAALTTAGANAATVKKGAKCSTAVSANVRGTQYSCKTGTWQPVAATVKVGRGCTYKGELARSGSTLVSCVTKARRLTWVKANNNCNEVNTLLNKTNASYNQSMAQVRRIEAQIKNMTGPDVQTFQSQIETIKSNLANVQELIKSTRSDLLQTCSRA